ECEMISPTYIETQLENFSIEDVKLRIIDELQERGFINVRIDKRPRDCRGVVSEFLVWEEPQSKLSKSNDESCKVKQVQMDNNDECLEAPPGYDTERFVRPFDKAEKANVPSI